MTAALVALSLLIPLTTDDHHAIESLSFPAGAYAPAVRLDPPVTVDSGTPLVPGLHNLPFAPADWTDHDRVQFYIDQWGLPAVFMRLAYRESRYRNDVRTWCCYGIFQLYIAMHLADHRTGPRMRTECEVFGVADIYGLAPLQEQKQMCAAAVLYQEVGLQPWR